MLRIQSVPKRSTTMPKTPPKTTAGCVELDIPQLDELHTVVRTTLTVGH